MNTVKNKKTVKTVKATDTKKVAEESKKNLSWAEQMAKIKEKQEAEAKIKAEEKAKKEAEKKKPGVIKTILETIRKSEKPINEATILEELVKEFPKREASGMQKTIKAQIGGKKRPLRMEREKKVIFDIKENNSGVRTYSLKFAE